MFKRDQRAVRLVLAMNVAFFVCWTPYAVLCFIHVFISDRYVSIVQLYYFYCFDVLNVLFIEIINMCGCYKCNFVFSVIGAMLSMVPTVTVKLSVCINPVLYIALNPQVRQSYLNLYMPGYCISLFKHYFDVT